MSIGISDIVEGDLQVELDSITDAIILQCERVLKRPLALPFQHDLMRLTPNSRSNLCLKKSCRKSVGKKQYEGE
jgi:hypothetical protein